MKEEPEDTLMWCDAARPGGRYWIILDIAPLFLSTAWGWIYSSHNDSRSNAAI